MESVRAMTKDFKITLHNKFALSTGEDERGVDRLSGNLATAIMASAAAVREGEATCLKQIGKLTQKTKEMILKRKKIKKKLSSTEDEIELAELSKLMNRNKTKRIRARNVAVIHETLKIEV